MTDEGAGHGDSVPSDGIVLYDEVIAREVVEGDRMSTESDEGGRKYRGDQEGIGDDDGSV